MGMSQLEKETLTNRINGIGEEEQEFVLKILPSELLWKEIKRSYDVAISTVNNAIGALTSENRG